MSVTSAKTLVLRLFERRSANGNQYWIGRLGAAKVVAFPNTQIELQFGAVGAIDVFVQAGNGDAGGGNRHTPIVPSAGVQHWKRPPAEEPVEGPPLDDDVSDLWRDS
jgi:hypothetical protein